MASTASAPGNLGALVDVPAAPHNLLELPHNLSEPNLRVGPAGAFADAPPLLPSRVVNDEREAWREEWREGWRERVIETGKSRREPSRREPTRLERQANLLSFSLRAFCRASGRRFLISSISCGNAACSSERSPNMGTYSCPPSAAPTGPCHCEVSLHSSESCEAGVEELREREQQGRQRSWQGGRV